jgi:hypothetical protein
VANEPASTGGQARFDRYAQAKARLAEALGDYLATVVEIGGVDAASSLELARQALVRDLHAAVNERVTTVPLTDVWAELADRDLRSQPRLDRG